MGSVAPRYLKYVKHAGRQRQYSITDLSARVRHSSLTETLTEDMVEKRLIPVVRHNLNNKHILTVKQFDRNTVSTLVLLSYYQGFLRCFYPGRGPSVSIHLHKTYFILYYSYTWT